MFHVPLPGHLGKSRQTPYEYQVPSEPPLSSFLKQEFAGAVYSAVPTAAPDGHVAVREPGNNGEELKEDDNFLIHVVAEEDTLTRLAVHYGVTENAIKRCNQFQMLGQHLDHLVKKPIRVPKVRGYVPPPEYDAATAAEKERQRTVRMLAKEAKCAELEAKFYLEECAWDYRKALAQVEEAHNWEKFNPPQALKPMSYTLDAQGRPVPCSAVEAQQQQQQKQKENEADDGNQTCCS